MAFIHTFCKAAFLQTLPEGVTLTVHNVMTLNTGLPGEAQKHLKEKKIKINRDRSNYNNRGLHVSV